MSEQTTPDGKNTDNTHTTADRSHEQTSLTSQEAREVTVTLQQLIKQRKRSIWDGPVELFKQFVKLVVPVTYFLGFLLMTVIVTDPSKLPWMDKSSGDEHTAYVDLNGAILTDGDANVDKIIPAMEKALKNEHSKALIIRINSPGGSPVQSDRMYEAIGYLRGEYEKPIYAVIEDIGASGAYYVASATDRIYANHSSMVGSIGVISSSFGYTELMQKVGVERRTYTAGVNKSMLSPFQPVTPAIEKHWEKILNSTHATFIERVKAGRGDVLKADDPSVFSGLIWDAQGAMDLGLIDEFGTLRSVARDVVEVEKLVDYSPPKSISPLSGALSGLSSEGLADAMTTALKNYSRVLSESESPTVSATY